MMLQPRFKELAQGAWLPVGLTTLCGLIIAGTYIAQGVLAAKVITHVLEGLPLVQMQGLLVWILVLLLARALLFWLSSVARMWTHARIKSRLRDRLYRQLLCLGPAYVETKGSAKVQSAIVDGVEAMEAYFSSYLPQLLITLLIPSGILLYVFTLNVWIGLVILAAIVSALVAPKWWEKLLGTYGQSHWDSYAQLNARFVDNMQGMATLKAFNLAEARGQELQQESHDLYKKTMKQLSISMLNTAVLSLAMKVGSAGVLALGAVLVLNNQLSFLHLMTLLFLASECMRPLSDLDRYWHQGYVAISASKGIFELLDAQPEVIDTGTLNQVQAPLKLQFKDVSFAYAGREQRAIKDLNFTLPAQKTYAVVGRSGAGKSTLVNLLLRFVEPQQGQILLNGEPLAAYSLRALRNAITVVQQDCYLFYGSVADNLRLAKPDASLAEIEAAAKIANAHDFITRLPQSYQTRIGERGSKLSGGERQRLAIARAVLKDAPILILDEATASVDAASEALINEALQRLSESKTTLIIAHRLSTVIAADGILVMDEGRGVEQGVHHELLQRQGLYAQLVALQKGAA